MTGIRRRCGVLILVLSFSTIAPAALFAQGGDSRVVVVLHSYHEGFTWTDRMNEGITEALSRFGEAIDIRIEYLDAKRSPLTGVYAEAVKTQLRLKYSTHKPALVVSTDNAALVFALAERDAVFGGAPIVFCGVNNFSPAMLGGQSGVTGITEDPDLAGTLHLARGITGADNIVLIVDGTDTGIQNRLIAEAAIRELGFAVKPVYLDGRTLSLPELLAELTLLTPDSLVLFLDFFEDRLGEYHPVSVTLPLICKASPVPVFTHADLYFGLGPIGGKLNRGIDQGRAAGIMAGRILDGESASAIPVEMPSRAVPVFDLNLLEKYGLLGQKLPADTLIINSPFSVFKTYRVPILIAGTSFVLLVSLLIVLLVVMASRRKVEQELRASREGLSSIYNGMNDAIFIHDPRTAGIIDVNQASVDVFGYSSAEFQRVQVADLSAGEAKDSDAQVRLLFARVNAGERLVLPWQSLRKDGTVFPSEVALRSANVGGRAVVIASVRDLTERTKDKEDLQRLLREKETLLKEVHHRIKNNMTTIRGLLSLQIDAEPNLSARQSLQNAERRVQSIIMLYDRLYVTDNYRELSVREYLEPLSEEIVGSFAESGKIRIETEIDDCILNVQQLTPLGIIVNELVSNMMKYAFVGRDSGVIRIVVTLQDRNLRLVIRDNGVGIPDAINFTHSTGFGMKIVGMLVEQIDASVRIVRGEGTSFILDLPL